MEETRTLANNRVCNFLLRIDLSQEANINFSVVAEQLKIDYDSFRTESIMNIAVNVDSAELRKEKYIKYLLGKAPSVCMKIDALEKSICIESVSYQDNSTYVGRLAKLIEVLKQQNVNVCARRIGMRFVNSFVCQKLNDISKVLVDNRPIKDSISKSYIARAIMVNEFNYGDSMARLQYGVPNKFYPSLINNYDVIVDIDVYREGIQKIDGWQESISDFNHKAYEIFTQNIKQSYLESLK